MGIAEDRTFANELKHLKVSDIDSQRMVLHVRHGKGGIPRDIALSPVLLERLRVYFRWRRPSDWLFPSKRHPDQLLDDASIRVLCRTAGRRAGLPRLVHPHLFRHYAASRTMPRVGARAAIHIGLSWADAA